MQSTTVGGGDLFMGRMKPGIFVHSRVGVCRRKILVEEPSQQHGQVLLSFHENEDEHYGMNGKLCVARILLPLDTGVATYHPMVTTPLVQHSYPSHGTYLGAGAGNFFGGSRAQFGLKPGIQENCRTLVGPSTLT